MTTRELLAVVAELAGEHAGPLTVDEFLEAPVVRCGRCDRIVWRERV